MKRFLVQYRVDITAGITTTFVTASNAREAKQKLLQRLSGNTRATPIIVSCIEQ